MYRRANGEAQNTRGEMSKTQTRLLDLQNYLTQMEDDIEEAATFVHAYVMRRGEIE